jgi:hypothetical protein
MHLCNAKQLRGPLNMLTKRVSPLKLKEESQGVVRWMQ